MKRKPGYALNGGDVYLLITFMKTSAPKFPLVAIAIYLLAVVVCISLAFDFAGATNPDWTLVLIGLTLPWSLVSIIFAWGLLHGAGLEFFTFLYLWHLQA